MTCSEAAAAEMYAASGRGVYLGTKENVPEVVVPALLTLAARVGLEGLMTSAMAGEIVL